MGCGECIVERMEISDRGNPKANIMVVGEAPSIQDVRQRLMLVSDAAKIMDDEMGLTGVSRGDIYYTSAIRCQIDKKKLGKKLNEVMENCRPNIVEIVNALKPKIIMPMGDVAYKQITKSTSAFKDVVGVVSKSEEFNCLVLPNHHPASLQYQANKKGEFRAIFKTLAELQQNNYVPNKVQIQYKIVESIRDLLDGGLQKDETGKFITALDTETQGLLWYRKNSPLISYSIAASETMGYQIFLQEECEVGQGDYDITIYRGGTQKKPLKVRVGIKRADNYDQKVAELNELLMREDIKKYFMNMKFEKHRFYNIGCREIKGACFDIGLAAHVLNSEEYVNVNLDTLIKHFDPTIETHKSIVSKTDKGDMLRMFREDRDNTVKYSALDACATLRVGRRIREQLLKDQRSANYYVKFAHPIETEFLFEIERNGFGIDMENLPVVADEVIREMAIKEQEFYELSPQAVKDNNPGNEFRLTRGAVMKQILYKWGETDIGFGLEPPKYTETGEPSVDKESLKLVLEMKHLPKQVLKLIELYNEWHDLHTIHTRYLNNIKEYATGGSLYPSYSITFTSSGRSGARNPSIHNFPKRGNSAKLIRKLMVARQGWSIVELDHSTLELRIIAAVANDREFKKVFSEDRDPHLELARKYSKVNLDDLPKDEVKKLRQSAKPIAFGLPYGMSPGGLQNYAKTYGVTLSDREAKDKHRIYFESHPDITAWHNRVRNDLMSKGSLRSIFGRLRTLSGAKSKDNAERASAFRIGVNFEIQNVASDLTLMGGHDIIKSEWYDKEYIKAIIFLHDALFFEVKDDKLQELVPKLKDCMENVDTFNRFGYKFDVKFIAESECGKRLSEMEKI